MTRTPVYFIGPIRDKGAGVAVPGRHVEYRHIDKPTRQLLSTAQTFSRYEQLVRVDFEIKLV